MRNLRGKTAALLGVAALALLALLVLGIIQGRYDTLLVGVIAFVAVVFASQSQATGVQKSIDKLAKNTSRIAQVADGVARLEDTVTSSPRMLEGSQERQIAETAARFDWLARKHTEQAERLDAFTRELDATLARQREEILTLLRPEGSAPTARIVEPDGSGTAGPEL